MIVYAQKETLTKLILNFHKRWQNTSQANNDRY